MKSILLLVNNKPTKQVSSFLRYATHRRRQQLKPQPGFTIVELLIVIVIIGILAAITIVAYSGIQQRANNTVIIDAASKSSRMIQAYIATNGSYPGPALSYNACITTDTGCNWGGTAYGANATFETNIATIGTLPRTIPSLATIQKGVMYGYNAARTMDGVVQPFTLIYYLQGTSQQCGLAGVSNTGGTSMITSTLGYTTSNDGGGRTACVISVPGPSS